MKILAWLQLVRLPNLPSAVTNVLAGFSFGQFVQGRNPLTQDGIPLALAAGASLCIYTAGMVWNDVADRQEDARTRPQRPLPSGAVSLGGARGLGVFLLLGALAFLLPLPGSVQALLIFLAGAAVGYDFFFKRFAVAGPLTLGVCRAGNFLVGVLVAGATGGPLLHALVVSGAYFFYVSFLSLLARMEDSQVRPESCKNFLWLAVLTLMALALLLPGTLAPSLLLMWSFLVAWKIRRIREWNQGTVGRLVGFLLMGIYVLDAGVATASMGWQGLVLLVFLPLGFYLRRWISPT